MSHAIVFDTLQYSKKLREAGFTETQAEIQAEALKELIEDNLATKSDIKTLEFKIKAMEQRIVMRLGSLMVVGIVVLAALIKF